MSEDVFEIPLSSGAQKFSIRLGENTLQIRLVWREAEGGGWFIDLFDNRRSGSDYGNSAALGQKYTGRARSSRVGSSDGFARW